jgi:tetratricopeptide (TPR) repeat protein
VEVAKNNVGIYLNLKEEAKRLVEEDNVPEAAKLLSKYLDDNWDDPEALFLMGYAFMKSESIGLAYQCFKRASDVFPGEAAIWHNIGKLYHEKQEDDKADEFFRKALKCKPDFSNSLEGLGMTHLNRGEFGLAIEYCNRALAENPEATEARINRGMAYLALKRWREGWPDYNANIGKDKNRKEPDYGCPRWDGTKGQDVVVYGEQGIGDEISFASMIPDLIRDSKSVTIECDGRLEKLFERSFKVPTYGTRYHPEKKGIIPPWRSEKKFDGKVAMGQLAEFYRLKDSDFKGEPYLTPNPQLVLQWKALLESLGDKPRIGISWTGGLPHTGQKKRSVTLDTYGPLFKSFDAHWISLQYKEPEVASAESKYGIKIHDFDWGNRVFDYDHTVALISQLDLVISVCTTVVHAAGGLGKECWCLVPAYPMWRYLHSGAWFPWAASVQLFRQRGREWPVGILLGKLRDRFGDGHLRKAA